MNPMQSVKVEDMMRHAQKTPCEAKHADKKAAG
jgi:hypothetical protein